MEKFKDKKIAVLGFGIEGISICEFLKDSRITVFDENDRSTFDQNTIKNLEKQGIIFKFGKITNIEGFDFIFRSPGILPSHKLLLKELRNGTVITSATQVFFDICPCRIIGVTGTKGKGTTSSLIYEMLKKQGFDAYLGGNIGTPPLSFIDKLSKNSKVVLEMSSFQLQDLTKSPHISVILMTTQEHLAPDKAQGTFQNYHKDIKEYVDAKRNIFKFQNSSDYAIVNKDYPASNESDVHTQGKVFKVSREQEVEEGCFAKDDAIIIKILNQEEKIVNTNDILLPGKHNLENVCAAIMAAVLAGVKTQAIVEVLKTFKGLKHRLELVKTVNGVRYYDDSFSTTPETAIAAIEAFTEPEILLLGGASKNSDFTELGRTISESKNIKAIIKIGEEWERIKLKVKNEKLKVYSNCQTMKEAVEKAADIATLGDVVLLSPACSSFDRFKNYKHRGEEFKKAVNNLT